ncbi:DUF2254 domain-containing protein [Larkinella humicola]|uniref:DUF2254 domain-containing protein n=1 Tax=Larkinella humicola TaxID=2607654 RepID=A0A5N1JEH8_9BACT|nr:DUF2254 domain-containing protein [Larkinella humicola]KAA9353442.1 DUF2254 domain-containing protein [Larkinella humicola]
MQIRLYQYWQSLQESLWFVPTLMVLASFGMAYGLITFDAETSFDGAKRFPLLFGAGAEGSRSMLTAIAGSMLTVAALVFSLTLSTITQVSSQYSPRVLRNFMRDRSNQVVMGYFVGVFAYCLIVLGTIRGTEEQKFVPSTAVLMGLLLALGGVAALIFFIHHIAESLQTGTIVEHISHETLKVIDELFPGESEKPVETASGDDARWRRVETQSGWQPVLSTKAGYIQHIDLDEVLRWAIDHRALLRVEQTIGSFVGEKALLFSVRFNGEKPGIFDSNHLHKLLDQIAIGRHRNIEQDVTFGIQQLVDIALKALSPGINDTTTAIMAIDYAGAIMERLASRNFPAPFRTDNGQLRILIRPVGFDHYLRQTFDLIRINAKGNHAVIRRLMRALSLVGSQCLDDDRKTLIREQARLLLQYAEQTLTTPYEKRQVQALYHEMASSWSN